jgi:hypothetical protein
VYMPVCLLTQGLRQYAFPSHAKQKIKAKAPHFKAIQTYSKQKTGFHSAPMKSAGRKRIPHPTISHLIRPKNNKFGPAISGGLIAGTA